MVDISALLSEMAFSKQQGGLIPAVAQDAATGEVLMLAYMNPESLAKTVETGEAHYFSRSRQKLWHKGGTSGHVQIVREILLDCDGDTLVLKVEQRGPGACHTGHRSCFHRRLGPEGRLETVGERAFDPKEVYSK
ncbi:MAG: phosphoribosyl-AMP cyclohydrolase [Pseudomonadota bacterium]